MKQTGRLVLVLDGQGGGMGAQLVRLLADKLPGDCRLLAVGTNVLATSAMLKAGAPQGATGENVVLFQAPRARVILGPIGIILANGILGEVSPAMAAAVGQSRAKKILVPMNQCDIWVAGVADVPVSRLLESAVDQLGRLLENSAC